MLFALGALRLHRRGERPLFLRPLLLLLGMVAISFVLGAIAGTTDADVGLNGLRDLSGYLFYIGLVGLIDSPRKLHSAIWLVFILAIASVSVQLVEASLGHRLTTPTTVASGYWAGTKTVEVGGLTAPYLWNRATGYLLVGLFLALG